MSETVRIDVAGGVFRIELARPEKKNALTAEMYRILADALARAEADPAVRVILISGAGGNFTAGNDLADFLETPPMDDSAPVYQFIEGFANLQKPFVAAVEGVAVGVGTTMLLHCDLVYAGSGARFALPFANLGLTPEAASSLLLPLRVGQARAAEMLMLGEGLLRPGRARGRHRQRRGARRHGTRPCAGALPQADHAARRITATDQAVDEARAAEPDQRHHALRSRSLPPAPGLARRQRSLRRLLREAQTGFSKFN
jgi:hypothetical protein